MGWSSWDHANYVERDPIQYLPVNAMFSTFISLSNIQLEHPFGPSPYSLVYYDA